MSYFFTVILLSSAWLSFCFIFLFFYFPYLFLKSLDSYLPWHRWVPTILIHLTTPFYLPYFAKNPFFLLRFLLVPFLFSPFFLFFFSFSSFSFSFFLFLFSFSFFFFSFSFFFFSVGLYTPWYLAKIFDGVTAVLEVRSRRCCKYVGWAVPAAYNGVSSSDLGDVVVA